jgi:hypothetical protein
MPEKIKTMQLIHFEKIDSSAGPPPYGTVNAWRVIKVTDSIEYAPGQTLLKPQVEELCANKYWKVTITGAV